LAEIHRATDPGDVQTMRVTAQLVGLDITVLHRQSPHEGTEGIAIHLRTLPTFAALHHSLGSLHPWAFWLEASRLAWHRGWQPHACCWALSMPRRQAVRLGDKG